MIGRLGGSFVGFYRYCFRPETLNRNSLLNPKILGASGQIQLHPISQRSRVWGPPTPLMRKSPNEVIQCIGLFVFKEWGAFMLGGRGLLRIRCRTAPNSPKHVLFIDKTTAQCRDYRVGS